MKQMTSDIYRNMLLAAAGRILRCEHILTRIDSAIGDGDHGIGMKNGMLAVRKALESAAPCTDIAALNRMAGEAMRNAMGGASGMIFSTLFSGTPDAGSPGCVMTPADFAAQMQGVYSELLTTSSGTVSIDLR